MAIKSKAAVLPAKGERLAVREIDAPPLKSNELLIEVHSLAINPVDWKIQDLGFLVQSWPHILGSDISGKVVAKGDGSQTSQFNVGDQVLGFANSLMLGFYHGAFQTHVVLQAESATLQPSYLSANDAAVLPMAVATSAMGIWDSLAIPRPADGTVVAPERKGEAIFVWGASSSVGALAVQLGKASGLKVYATASEKHASWIKDLGAAAVVDYRGSNVVADVVAAADKDGVKILYAFDSIAEGERAKHTSVLSAEIITRSAGKGKLTGVAAWPEAVEKPKDVELSTMFAAVIGTSSIDLGRWIFNEWLRDALQQKVIVPAPKAKVVGSGLEAIQPAMDEQRNGVSGCKLVVELSSST